MNCPSCDRYTPDNSPVCIHCGAKLPEVDASRPANRLVGTPRDRKVNSGRAFSLFSGRNLMILGVVLLVGVLLFFVFRSSPSHGYVTDYPDGPINLSSMVVAGKTNIVDLYSEFCPPCRAIAPYLEKLGKQRSDIYIIRININRKGHSGIDWGSPIARQFNLKSIPHFIIVNGDGKVLKEGKSAYGEVVDMIKASLNS